MNKSSGNTSSTGTRAPTAPGSPGVDGSTECASTSSSDCTTNWSDKVRTAKPSGTADLEWALLEFTVELLRLEVEVAAFKRGLDPHLPAVLEGADRSWDALLEAAGA